MTWAPMTDDHFMGWLEGFCARTRGCEFGLNIPFYRHPDGSIDRERTLRGALFVELSDSCRKRLLAIP